MEYSTLFLLILVFVVFLAGIYLILAGGTNKSQTSSTPANPPGYKSHMHWEKEAAKSQTCVKCVKCGVIWYETLVEDFSGIKRFICPSCATKVKHNLNKGKEGPIVKWDLNQLKIVMYVARRLVKFIQSYALTSSETVSSRTVRSGAKVKLRGFSLLVPLCRLLPSQCIYASYLSCVYHTIL